MARNEPVAPFERWKDDQAVFLLKPNAIGDFSSATVVLILMIGVEFLEKLENPYLGRDDYNTEDNCDGLVKVTPKDVILRTARDVKNAKWLGAFTTVFTTTSRSSKRGCQAYSHSVPS
uniref:Uncharacterized protein n=1 Tax=Bionectria ochroleuca TaxID=29856 RepID=A0A8H7KFG5_BIOOC